MEAIVHLFSVCQFFVRRAPRKQWGEAHGRQPRLQLRLCMYCRYCAQRCAPPCNRPSLPHQPLLIKRGLPSLQVPPIPAFPADFSRGTVEGLLAGIVDASECH